MKRGEKMEHSIKAGLMITSVSDYNMEICRGANEACKELGIELVIFFGGSVDPNVKFVQSSDYQKAKCLCFCKLFGFRFFSYSRFKYLSYGSKKQEKLFQNIFIYQLLL